MQRMRRRFLAIFLTVAMIFAMASPATAGGNSTAANAAQTITWTDGFGFHCNNGNGNGRTDVIVGGRRLGGQNSNHHGLGTNQTPIVLERVGTTTTWNLLTDAIVCATCGRTDWVTYSNNNGVINGRNIQVNHKAVMPEPAEPTEPEFRDDHSNCRTIVQEMLNAGYNVIIRTLGSGGFGISPNHPTGDFIIPAGVYLKVETILNVRTNSTLIVKGTLIIAEGARINSDTAGRGTAAGGTIIVAESGTFYNHGTVEISGSEPQGSTLINHGRIVNSANSVRFTIRAYVHFFNHGEIIGDLIIHRDAIRYSPGVGG